MRRPLVCPYQRVAFLFSQAAPDSVHLPGPDREGQAFAADQAAAADGFGLDNLVPLQNVVTWSDLRVSGLVYAARCYSLITPPSTLRRRTGAASGTTTISS